MEHATDKPPEKVDEPQAASPEAETKPRKVKKHMQCPICFNGYGGKGEEKWWKRVSGTMVKRAYTCDQCGHNWTATVKTHTTIVVEHHEVTVNHGNIDNIQTRG